jgi:hypothetical protein
MGSLVRDSCRCGFIDLERHRDGFIVAVYLRFVTFIMIKMSGVLESKGLTFVSVKDVKSLSGSGSGSRVGYSALWK